MQNQETAPQTQEATAQSEYVQVKRSELEALIAQNKALKARDSDFTRMLHASTYLIGIIKDDLFGGTIPGGDIGLTDYMRMGNRAFKLSKKIEKDPDFSARFGKSFATVVDIGGQYLYPESQHTIPNNQTKELPHGE
ncbi:hypothetical protein [Edaphocola aurantiacus]|uniref:hypothetical protein n=1 Tax=Edaphocola aurantiacus TaxID=2601682 RepID=UPI001C95FEE5|nr:hypothetical protein [Edaphocola aurantiacus]